MDWVNNIRTACAFFGVLYCLWCLPGAADTQEAVVYGLSGIIFAIFHQTFYGRE